MKQILIVAIFGLAFLGCQSTSEPAEKVMGKKFFDYDEIDYYFNDLDDSKIIDLCDNQYKSKIDSFKMGVILGELPNDLPDESFIENLEKAGYKKKLLSKEMYKQLDSIFVEKSVSVNLATSSIRVYSYMLIFKKDHKVIGMAKACLPCMAHKIVGTSANTVNFGQDGDYERLQELLNSIK